MGYHRHSSMLYRLGIRAVLLVAIFSCAVPGKQAKAEDYSGWQRTEDPGRDAMRETALILEALALSPGMYVAEIGAGAGYFAFKFSRLVGDEGRVYATEVDFSWFKHLERAVAERGASNVLPRWVLFSSHTGLPADSVDAINAVYILEPLSQRPGWALLRVRSLLESFWKTLRKGGRVVIVNGTRRNQEGMPQEPQWLLDLAARHFVIEQHLLLKTDSAKEPPLFLVLRRRDEPVSP